MSFFLKATVSSWGETVTMEIDQVVNFKTPSLMDNSSKA